QFWFDLVNVVGIDPAELLPALWDLVWAGEVTNDAWTPLRAGRRYGVLRPERRPRRFSRRRSTAITATQGRWSLTGRLFAGTADRRALAELLLERQGIVTRDGVRGEGIVGGYSAVDGGRKGLETVGASRGGHFAGGGGRRRSAPLGPPGRGASAEGPAGAGFGRGGAAEPLRELRPREGEEPDAL